MSSASVPNVSPSSRNSPDPRGADAARNASPWVADLGDGTYQNPILFADYSDPDAVCVGQDYWMIASSFCHVPGLPILHSLDLVNWTLVNHALPQLVPADHFATPRHGGGVWAPTIRYHQERYWIFYPDPDFGIYVITAADPRGAWSAPHLVLPGRGLIDPCPLWDDDGRCFLVHGWARSRSGINNVVTLQELTPDGLAPLGPGRIIIDGHRLPDWHTLEGPKLYKREGWYWVFAPSGGVGEGYQAVFRSRQIQGPYEHRIVLAQGRTSVNGPHQGAWVETPEGEHWFLHFQELPAYGRVVHLQPVRWRADGWPEMGEPVDAAGRGEPVLRHRKPALPPQPIAAPATTDRFDGSSLGRQWQWQGNPSADWLRFAPVSGRLLLRCVPLAADRRLWLAPHLLMQKFPAPTFVVTTSLRLTNTRAGEQAGLIVFGYDYAWLGLRHRAERQELVLVTCHDAPGGASEADVASAPGPAIPGDGVIHLRVEVRPGARCQFSWSSDGSAYRAIGQPFGARSSRWVGAKVGLFASAPPGTAGDGTAVFGAFHMTNGEPTLA